MAEAISARFARVQQKPRIVIFFKNCVLGLLGALGVLIPALAQTSFSTGFQPGDILVRLRVDGVIPQNYSSSVALTGSNALAGSKVHVSRYGIPEADLSYFFVLYRG